ncbi:MAG TPA: hypothetical protein VFS20_15805 [Longimicrobium sp.]|nr:hypothetical protein [Longimicrobium sp.]
MTAVACGRPAEGSDASDARAALHVQRRAGALDLTTPEAALQTYWRLSDAEMLSAGEAPVNSLDSLFTGPAGVARAQSRVPETFAREIVEVERRGARAFVTVRVRNTTPRPVGAVPSPEERQRRRHGDQFRYVLAHDASGWKIEQIQSREFDEDEWRDWYDPTPRLPVHTTP